MKSYISLHEFEKALNSLKIALNLFHQQSPSDHQTLSVFRDACIQRFEYCIELSWKTSMKILGSNTLAAKPAIREMARNNLISNPELWISFIESRNNTSHSYDESIAHDVFTSIQSFYPEACSLLEKLIPSQILSEIREELEESTLPIKVDLVLERNLASSYREAVSKDLQEFAT